MRVHEYRALPQLQFGKEIEITHIARLAGDPGPVLIVATDGIYKVPRWAWSRVESMVCRAKVIEALLGEQTFPTKVVVDKDMNFLGELASLDRPEIKSIMAGK